MAKKILIITAIVLVVAICAGLGCYFFLNRNDDSGENGTKGKREDKTTTYQVTFNSNGGSDVAAQSVAAGQFAVVPEMPVRDKQIFVGWFTDQAFTEEYDFSSPINGNITLYAKWTNLYLRVSCSEFLVGEGNTVYFYAEASDNVQAVFLKSADNDSVTIQLKDDGNYSQSGDDLPNDNIFSGKINVWSDTKTTYEYYAVSGSSNDVMSQTVSIHFIEKLTNQELNDIETVDARIQAELFNCGTYDEMDMGQRKQKAYDILKALEAEGFIIPDSIIYDAASYTYSFQYKSGVCGSVVFKTWQTEIEASSASNASNGGYTINQLDTATNSSKTSLDLGDAIILWSFNQAWDDAYYREPFYQEVEKKWDGAGLETTVVWDTTVEDYKELSSYEVILFSGHGAYMTYTYNGAQTTCSSLILRQKSSYGQNRSYSADLTQFRIGLCSVQGGTMYAILPNFFEHYYDRGDLDNSFVFAENCEFRGKDGQENARIPNALRNASAEAVIGFHNSVMADYSRDLATYFVDRLIEGQSAGEAYDAALQTYGKDDYFKNREKYGPTAYPLFAGDRAAYLVKVGIENGSFEEASGLGSWSTVGDVRVLTKLGSLVPAHQLRTAILTTGIGSAEEKYLDGTEGSVLSQTFKIPANAKNLTFSYDMVSEEPSEYVGSQYDDTFVVRLITKDGTIEITKNTINTAKWYSISGINFPDGDETTYHTQQKDISYNISDLAGQVVTLEFVIYDKGDSIYDTAVLVDNIVLY